MFAGVSDVFIVIDNADDAAPYDGDDEVQDEHSGIDTGGILIVATSVIVSANTTYNPVSIVCV